MVFVELSLGIHATIFRLMVLPRLAQKLLVFCLASHTAVAIPPNTPPLARARAPFPRLSPIADETRRTITQNQNADRAWLRRGGDVLGSVFRVVFGGGGGLLQAAGEPHDGRVFRGHAVRTHLFRPRVVSEHRRLVWCGAVWLGAAWRGVCWVVGAGGGVGRGYRKLQAVSAQREYSSPSDFVHV